jgi:hypothetical protein
MKDQKDYFDTLGLKPDASPEEIISAYKTLKEYWNPDRVPDYYKQKAMEGRDKIEEAYQKLMGLRSVDQRQIPKPTQKAPEKMEPEQQMADTERAFLGKDRNDAELYLDMKTIVFHKDRTEIEVNIYPPAGSNRFLTSQGYVRRAGYEGLDCIVEKWGLGLSNRVFTKHGTHYKSKCGHLIDAAVDVRKVWKPIAPGSVEEMACQVIDGMMSKKKGT